MKKVRIIEEIECALCDGLGQIVVPSHGGRCWECEGEGRSRKELIVSLAEFKKLLDEEDGE